MHAPPIQVPRTRVQQLLVRQIHVALIHVLLTLVLLTLAQLIRAPQKLVALTLVPQMPVVPTLALLKTPVPQPILVPLVGRVLHQLHHLMLAKRSFKRFMNA